MLSMYLFFFAFRFAEVCIDRHILVRLRLCVNSVNTEKLIRLHVKLISLEKNKKNCITDFLSRAKLRT